jgi:hypothetical protein
MRGVNKEEGWIARKSRQQVREEGTIGEIVVRRRYGTECTVLPQKT